MKKSVDLSLFELYNEKSNKYPVIITLPHSGTYIPEIIREKFVKRPNTILTNMDWYLDKLYSFLIDMQVTILKANYSRFVVDVNRKLDEPLVGSGWKSVIFNRTLFDKPLYSNPLTKEEIQFRLENYYNPYHQKIAELLKIKLEYFEKVYLIDMHSFFISVEKDIVVGNDDGKTSSDEFFNLVVESLKHLNFSVGKNEVWKAGHTVRKYGAMDRIESIVIEIRFTAYLEDRFFGEEENPTYDPIIFAYAQKRLKSSFGTILNNLIK